MGGNEWWHPTISGVIGGTSCVLAGQPFDTVKVRLQTQQITAGGVRAFSGPLDCLSQTIKREGLRTLYKGSSAALASVITENAVLFTANSAIKRLLTGGDATRELTIGQHFLAGGLSGVFSATAICPAEVVKCTLQVQQSAPPATAGVARKRLPAPLVRPIAHSNFGLIPVTTYTTLAAPAAAAAAAPFSAISLPAGRTVVGPLDIVRHIARTEGVRGFYRGLPSLWVRDIPFNFAFLGSYEGFNALFASVQGVKRNDLGGTTLFTSGGLAGMVGWAVVFPIDVVKSRIQTGRAGPNASSLAVALDIARKEGAGAFYRGCSAAVMRAFPANAALLLGFELSHKLFSIEQ